MKGAAGVIREQTSAVGLHIPTPPAPAPVPADRDHLACPEASSSGLARDRRQALTRSALLRSQAPMDIATRQRAIPASKSSEEGSASRPASAFRALQAIQIRCTDLLGKAFA